MNLANEIKAAANKERLSYWDYVKKYQDKLRLPFRYVIVDTTAILEEEHRLKEEKRKKKYEEDK